MPDSSTARELGEALHPILRRLLSGRTISVGKLGILGYLDRQGRATATTLAAAQHVSPQAIATAVRELEALGLVERTPDSEDRRKAWIELTALGRVRLRAERAASLDWLENAVAERLTDDERALLDRAVPALRKLAGTEPLA
ncbi:MarR family transcriptional regulator [Nocardia sp. NPDC048505]|uniref:MarR family winged helix-turn-helix transcriptional regulator n=1 Tax=unclassified Nocardia TaxID=2637762 RepID=UPI00340C37DA